MGRPGRETTDRAKRQKRDSVSPAPSPVAGATPVSDPSPMYVPFSQDAPTNGDLGMESSPEGVKSPKYRETGNDSGTETESLDDVFARAAASIPGRVDEILNRLRDIPVKLGKDIYEHKAIRRAFDEAHKREPHPSWKCLEDAFIELPEMVSRQFRTDFLYEFYTTTDYGHYETKEKWRNSIALLFPATESERLVLYLRTLRDSLEENKKDNVAPTRLDLQAMAYFGLDWSTSTNEEVAKEALRLAKKATHRCFVAIGEITREARSLIMTNDIWNRLCEMWNVETKGYTHLMMSGLNVHESDFNLSIKGFGQSYPMAAICGFLQRLPCLIDVDPYFQRELFTVCFIKMVKMGARTGAWELLDPWHPRPRGCLYMPSARLMYAFFIACTRSQTLKRIFTFPKVIKLAAYMIWRTRCVTEDGERLCDGAKRPRKLAVQLQKDIQTFYFDLLAHLETEERDDLLAKYNANSGQIYRDMCSVVFNREWPPPNSAICNSFWNQERHYDDNTRRTHTYNRLPFSVPEPPSA